MDKFLSWLQELRGLLSHPSDLLEFTYSQNGEGEKFGAVNKTDPLLDLSSGSELLRSRRGKKSQSVTFSPTNEELIFVPIQGISSAKTGGFYAG
jgi:hypothetical protein